jgi:sec-independent protein translocase protein TatB
MGISPPIQVATIGMGDSLVLMVIALVVLGPRRLPQVGRQIGKLMYEFRKASNDFKFQMEEELRSAEEADRRKREDAERQRALAETQAAVARAQSAADQALNAAAKAQSAAEAAQGSVNGSQVSVPESGPAIDVSQVPESGPGAPTSGLEVHDPAAEPGLRVQPPSIGEQIPASRPGHAGPGSAGVTPAAEASEQPAGTEQEIHLKKEVAAETGSGATETAANHG